MEKEQLMKLTAALPRGTKALLSKQFNISRSQISKILDGEGYNSKVIEAALRIALEEKERNNYISTNMKSL